MFRRKVAFLSICSKTPGWQLSSGMGGSFQPEWPATFTGISGRFQPEYAIEKALQKFPDACPRLITDNGKQFVGREFKQYICRAPFEHVRTSPYYPQSNGKIEAFHKNIKTECIRRESFLTEQELKAAVQAYIDYYNNVRLHSGIHYLPPVAMLNGTAEAILKQRDQKLQAARDRRQANYLARRSQKQTPENGKSTEGGQKQAPNSVLFSVGGDKNQQH